MIDIPMLFIRPLDHLYSPIEPFRSLETNRVLEIGSAQNSKDFQGIPVTIYISDIVGFGLYVKFYILQKKKKEEASSSQTTRKKNVFEESLSP